MTHDYFRVVGVHDTILDYADLFIITLGEDNIQEFHTKWDEVPPSISKSPPKSYGKTFSPSSTLANPESTALLEMRSYALIHELKPLSPQCPTRSKPAARVRHIHFQPCGMFHNFTHLWGDSSGDQSSDHITCHNVPHSPGFCTALNHRFHNTLATLSGNIYMSRSESSNGLPWSCVRRFRVESGCLLVVFCARDLSHRLARNASNRSLLLPNLASSALPVKKQQSWDQHECLPTPVLSENVASFMTRHDFIQQHFHGVAVRPFQKVRHRPHHNGSAPKHHIQIHLITNISLITRRPHLVDWWEWAPQDQHDVWRHSPPNSSRPRRNFGWCKRDQDCELRARASSSRNL